MLILGLSEVNRYWWCCNGSKNKRKEVELALEAEVVAVLAFISASAVLIGLYFTSEACILASIVMYETLEANFALLTAICLCS